MLIDVCKDVLLEVYPLRHSLSNEIRVGDALCEINRYINPRCNFVDRFVECAAFFRFFDRPLNVLVSIFDNFFLNIPHRDTVAGQCSDFVIPWPMFPEPRIVTC